MRLDLACGAIPREGFEGVDLRPLEGVSHVVDLTSYPWPWDDDSVEALHCGHYVEHVMDLVAFMNECHRILVPGGTLEILHPYQHSDRAWQDPTHVRALNFESWRYYDAATRDEMGEHYGGITADFEVVDKEAIVSTGLASQFPDGQVPAWMLAHCVNVIDDVRVVLKKR